MARRTSAHPTELELEILKIIWREGPLPVSRVREGLEPFRKLAITSVTTVMNIMVGKGYLHRAKEGSSYAYRAGITQEKCVRSMLRDTVDRVFEGSAMAAMLNLLDVSRVKREELEELSRLIAQKAKEELEP